MASTLSRLHLPRFLPKLLPAILCLTCFSATASAQVPDALIDRASFGFEGGYARRLAGVSPEIPPELREYYADSRNSWNLAFQAIFPFAPPNGLGLYFNRFRSWRSHEGTVTIPNLGEVKYIEDKIVISTFGAGLHSEQAVAGGRILLSADLGLGYMTISDEAKVGNGFLYIEGSTMGFLGAAGLWFRPYRLFAIGTQLRYQHGFVSDIRVNGQDAAVDAADGTVREESLSRLDLNLGLRFFMPR